MGGEDDGVGERGEALDDRAQPCRVVGVLGPVDGREHERARLEVGQDRGRVVGDQGRGGEAHVGHDVAGDDRAVAQALGTQVREGDLGRGEAQVGCVVGEHPVVLLGHPAVERPQAGLEVGQRQVQLHRGEGTGERASWCRRRRAPSRGVLEEDGVHRREHGAGLDPVGAGADAEVDVGGRDVEILEEDVGHVGVVVLARVDDDVLVARGGHRVGDGRELDELGAGTDDRQDSHGWALPWGAMSWVRPRRAGP